MWRKDSLIFVCILCLRLRYSWIFQLGFTCLVSWLPACFRLGQHFALHVFCCHSRLLLIFFCLWLNAMGLGMLRWLKSLQSQSLFSIPGKEFFDFGESRLATALSIVSGTILLLLCTCYQSSLVCFTMAVARICCRWLCECTCCNLAMLCVMSSLCFHVLYTSLPSPYNNYWA